MVIAPTPTPDSLFQNAEAEVEAAQAASAFFLIEKLCHDPGRGWVEGR